MVLNPKKPMFERDLERIEISFFDNEHKVDANPSVRINLPAHLKEGEVIERIGVQKAIEKFESGEFGGYADSQQDHELLGVEVAYEDNRQADVVIPVYRLYVTQKTDDRAYTSVVRISMTDEGDRIVKAYNGVRLDQGENKKR